MIFYIYLLFELSYYLYFKLYIYRVLNNRCYTKNRGIIPKELSKEIYEHIKEYITNEEDIIKYLRDTIPNSKLLTIENIKKILLYQIYNIHPRFNKEYDKEYDNNINEIIDIIKQRIGSFSLIQPDTCTSCNDIISCHFMINKLDIVYKPCIFYIFMYFIRIVFNYYMYTLGFTNIIDPRLNLRVWIKYNDTATNKIPFVFIHGVGCGIVPYITKISELSDDRRTVIIPELPNLSYDLYKFLPPSNDEIITSLYNILIKRGIELIDITGHSYGTIILNMFQIKYPHMCNYKTYAEPGCFYIQQTQSGNAIVFKKPFNNILEYIINVILYRDIYIQYIFNRSAFYENMLIKNLDDKTTIILTKGDEMVPSFHIHKYITTYYPHVRLEMIEGVHGAYVFE